MLTIEAPDSVAAGVAPDAKWLLPALITVAGMFIAMLTLGLAALGTMITAQQAQLLADRSALLQPDSQLARLAGTLLHQSVQWTAATFADAYRLGMTLQLHTMATAFANMFLVITVVTAATILLTLQLRRTGPEPIGDATPVSIESTTEPTAAIEPPAPPPPSAKDASEMALEPAGKR